MHLLGAIGAIILLIIMMPGFLGWWESGHTATQQRIVANHMTAVTRAARQYVNPASGHLADAGLGQRRAVRHHCGSHQ